MNKKLLYILALIIITGIAITACTSPNLPTNTQVPNNAPNNNVPPQSFNRSGANGNITVAQRQAMFQQRQQAAIDACSGKNAGDSCVLGNSRFNMTGTCNTLNDTIQCMTNRSYGGSRGYNPPAN